MWDGASEDTGGEKDKESGVNYIASDSPHKDGSKRKVVIGSKVSKAVTTADKGEREPKVL